jgi:hypothetical protein
MQSGGLSDILASRTADYMLAAAGDKPDPKLDQETIEHWRKYLASSDKDHPYLKPWFAAKTAAERAKAAQDFQTLILSINDEKKLVDEKNHITLGLNPDRQELSQANLVSLERDRFVAWEDLFSDKKGILHYGDGKIDRFLSGEWKGRLEILHTELAADKKDLPERYPFLQIIEDKPKLTQQHLWIRGDKNNPGELTPPHFVSILSPGEPARFTHGSGRLDLAEAITDPANPLTPRVIVNRLWQHHFGQGLVRTPSNFGELGDRPANPELLDYLASEFVKNGWSIKKMQRMIMLSATYQLSAEPNPKDEAVDPENRLAWRYNLQRLDAESLRDDMLFVSGNLDLKQGGLAEHFSDKNDRRTVYCFVSRRKLDPTLALFDFPNPINTSEQRLVTNVPLQRLYFMNNEWVIDQAKAFVAKLQGDDEKRIDEAYRLLFQRAPEPEEKQLGLAFLKEAGGAPEQKAKGWAEYAQTLITSNEFQFLD